MKLTRLILTTLFALCSCAGCGGHATTAARPGETQTAVTATGEVKPEQACADRWNNNDFGGLVSEGSSTTFEVEAIDSTTCAYSFPMSDGAGGTEYAAVTSSSPSDTVANLQQAMAIAPGPAPGYRSNAVLNRGRVSLSTASSESSTTVRTHATTCPRTHSIGTDDVVVTGMSCSDATALGDQGPTALSAAGFDCVKTGEGSEGTLGYTAWSCERGSAHFTFRYYASTGG